MKKVILMIFICISIFKLNAAKKVDLGVGLKSNISITRSFVIKQRENIIQDETIKLSYNMVGLVCPIYFNLLERNKLSFGLLYNLPGISFNLNKSFDLINNSLDNNYIAIFTTISTMPEVFIKYGEKRKFVMESGLSFNITINLNYKNNNDYRLDIYMYPGINTFFGHEKSNFIIGGFLNSNVNLMYFKIIDSDNSNYELNVLDRIRLEFDLGVRILFTFNLNKKVSDNNY